jgi:hypothetical protein
VKGIRTFALVVSLGGLLAPTSAAAEGRRFEAIEHPFTRLHSPRQ